MYVGTMIILWWFVPFHGCSDSVVSVSASYWLERLVSEITCNVFNGFVEPYRTHSVNNTKVKRLYINERKGKCCFCKRVSCTARESRVVIHWMLFLFYFIYFLFQQFAESFNFNPHKWMLVNFDCSAMW